MALREARATVPAAPPSYCTLEPCNHFGRTPPVHARADRRGRRSRGRRRRATRTSGVDAPGLARAARGRDRGRDRRRSRRESRRLNEAFERHVATGLPFVTLKMAASLDGKTAAARRHRRSGSPARTRAPTCSASERGADAVVVGAGTAVADDPSLTVRDARFDRGPSAPPRRGRRGRPGPCRRGRLFDGAAPTLVATTDGAPDGQRRARGRDAGAEVLVLDRDATGGVSLAGAARGALGKRDVQGVLVEGGATLAWSFVRDGLVDEVVLYIAPKLVGGASAPRRRSPGRGSRRSPRRCDAVVRVGRAGRRRPAGGGPCSPGSLRSAATVRDARRRTGSWWAAASCRSTAAIGASVAVNGVCLTVVANDGPTPGVRPVGGDDRAHQPAPARRRATR